MKAIYSFTLKSLMRSLKTYIFLAAMLLAEGAFITYVNFKNQYSAIEYSLEFIEIALMLCLPLITAEIFAFDRENGFEKTLLALGVSLPSLFFGRLLAVLTVFSAPYAILLIMPPLFDIFGIVNYASAYPSLIAYLMFAVSVISLLVFVSLSVRKRLYSYIIGYAAVIACYLFGAVYSFAPTTRGLNLVWLTVILLALSVAVWAFTKSTLVFGGVFCVGEALLVMLYFIAPRFFSGALSALLWLISPGLALNGVIYGPFDLTEIVHLLLFSAVFILLSIMQLKRRKYE